MRQLSANEKEIIKRIARNDKVSFDNILGDRLPDSKITVDFNNRDAKIFYNPDSKEDIAEQTFIELITVVNLIRLLEREAYIVLFKKVVNFNKSDNVIGNKSIGDNHAHIFDDNKIIGELLDLSHIDIYPTEELKYFVKKFKTREQRNHSQTILWTIISISIAFLLGIIPLVLNYFDKTAENELIKIRQTNEELIKITNEIRDLKTMEIKEGAKLRVDSTLKK